MTIPAAGSWPTDMTSMREALESDVEPIYGPPRPGDVRHSLLDPSRARRDLGWEARVAIEDGLRRTLDFFAARQG